MAQNEMKAKPASPERVRSMEGLGGCWTKAQTDDTMNTEQAFALLIAIALVAVVAACVDWRELAKPSGGLIETGAAPIDPCIGCQQAAGRISGGVAASLCHVCGCLFLSKEAADRYLNRDA